MEFIDGIPLTDLGSKVEGLSEAKKEAAKRRILTRLSEAYGMMILKEGLFQVNNSILLTRPGCFRGSLVCQPVSLLMIH